MSLGEQPYDAILFVSFGGPEGPGDVIPFLENVLRGRRLGRERMLEVADHYNHFHGVSPLNEQNRTLIRALETQLDRQGPRLPVYWGNRNWHPLLVDTLRRMTADGVQRALGFFTSAYSSYSGCRQYCENIAAAQAEIGPAAPRVDKLRVFYNHPGFIEPMIEHVRSALDAIPAERRAGASLVYTAHSLPQSMAANCRYQIELEEVCRLVAQGVGRQRWTLAYQSRSGPASQPWLEPDIRDHLRALAGAGVRDVVVAPIGFISDHLEILYDLDTEARQLCQVLGLNMVRAATVGAHPQFVSMIRELVLERIESPAQRRALGRLGPGHDRCPADCCLAGRPQIPLEVHS